MGEFDFSSAASASQSATEPAKTPAAPNQHAAFGSQASAPSGVIRRPAPLFSKSGTGAGGTGGQGGGKGQGQQQSNNEQEMADTPEIEVFEMPRPARRVNTNLFQGYGLDTKKLTSKPSEK